MAMTNSSALNDPAARHFRIDGAGTPSFPFLVSKA